MKKRVLGKGLEALIRQNSELPRGPSSASHTEESSKADPFAFPSVRQLDKTGGPLSPGSEGTSSEKDQGIMLIPIRKVIPNSEQPRTRISESALGELADSIREKGILQPVIVTRKGEFYELVCGERRWRAAGRAGLESIPAVVKEVADSEKLEIALIENIQREDLNILEEARAYLKLLGERGLTQDEIAKRVGKNRSTIANAIRLLKLHPDILNSLIQGGLSGGHARALLALPSLDHQQLVTGRILKEGLSVRQTEEVVQAILAGKRPARRARILGPEIISLEQRLAKHLGAQVKIYHGKKGNGRLEIRYFSLDELDRILTAIGVAPE